MSDVALLQFVNAKGAGSATIRRLAAVCTAQGLSPNDCVQMPRDELAALLEVPADVAENIITARDSASALATKLGENGIHVIWLNDSMYPRRLTAILGNDAPPVLFVKGNLELLRWPAVGFCGSRHASHDGLDVTKSAAKILAQERVCVISGYAHGVDLTAHRAAMETGGVTIMVLAEGILHFRAKKEIGEFLQETNYLAISQFPPGLPWISRNAMKRNSTIIGLAGAMILVESGRDGGTFAAGTETLRHHCPLFVVDFAKPGPSAEANPYFIERGGVPLRGNRDRTPILEKVLDAVRRVPCPTVIEQRLLF